MEEQVIQETPVASPEQPVAEQSDLSAQLEAVKAVRAKKSCSESWMSS
jgi:hypothetical protein